MATAHLSAVTLFPSASSVATLAKVRAVVPRVHWTTDGIPGDPVMMSAVGSLLTELLNPSDEAGAGVADVVAGRPIAARATGVFDRGHATVHVCHLMFYKASIIEILYWPEPELHSLRKGKSCNKNSNNKNNK